MIKRSVVFVAALLVLCSVSFAWSAKEHILLARCAARGLLENPAVPADMKQWLREAQPLLGDMESERQFLISGRVGTNPHGVDGLAFWAVFPDLIGREQKTAPWGIAEGQLHFIDLEHFMPKVADRTFAADLSHKPKLQNIPRDAKDTRWAKAGMLPFRLENCYQQTVKHLRAGRLMDKPGVFPRDEHAVKWAGMLAHYAADNTMPMHATAGYQAASFFAGISNAPKVHFDMEYKLIDDDRVDYPQIRQALWEAFVAELKSVPAADAEGDVWAASVKISLGSYDALPLIGQAARAAYLDDSGKLKPFDADAFVNYSGEVAGLKTTLLQMKAHQWALAKQWIEAVWLQAWRDAHTPAGQAN